MKTDRTAGMFVPTACGKVCVSGKVWPSERRGLLSSQGTLASAFLRQAIIGGDHLSDTTCLTHEVANHVANHVANRQRKTHKTDEAVFGK